LRIAFIAREKQLSDAAIDEALLATASGLKAKKPSVEAVFHSGCWTLPDIISW